MVPGSEENSWEVHIISTGWGVSWHGITPIGNSSEQVGSVSRGESGQCPAPSTERISNDVPQPIPESSWLIRSPPSLSLVSSPIFSSGSPWSLRWTWWSTVSPLCPLFTCSLPRWNLGLGSESFIFWDSIRSSHIISSGEPGAPDTSGKPEAPDTSEGLEEEGKEGASNDIGGGNLNLRFRDGEKSGLSVSPFTSKTFYEFWFFQCCLVEPVILWFRITTLNNLKLLFKNKNDLPEILKITYEVKYAHAHCTDVHLTHLNHTGLPTMDEIVKTTQNYDDLKLDGFVWFAWVFVWFTLWLSTEIRQFWPVRKPECKKTE